MGEPGIVDAGEMNVHNRFGGALRPTVSPGSKTITRKKTAEWVAKDTHGLSPWEQPAAADLCSGDALLSWKRHRESGSVRRSVVEG